MDGTLPVADRPRPPMDEPPPRRRRLPFIVLGLVLIAGAIGGGAWWLNARHYETTDDAAIDTGVSQLSARIAGRVDEIPVDDNQLVKRGQILVRLDPRDEQVKLDQAKAQLETAQAQLAQANANVDVTRAAVAQAEANARMNQADLDQAQSDYKRFVSIDPRAVTRQQIDSATSGLHSAQAKFDAARQQVDGQKAQLGTAVAQVQSAQASVHTAQVGVENAQLQLSYTDIAAPQAGRVTGKTVELGNYVVPGQALLAVVPQEVWITANFKETQLTDMHPGQKVDITLDAYPGTFQGHVDSIQSGTGSIFSSIPVENATGNWVKVLQRVPVKILFDDPRTKDLNLFPGLSVGVSVKVR
jgi:membrane fusion protein, multidrug efflux system